MELCEVARATPVDMRRLTYIRAPTVMEAVQRVNDWLTTSNRNGDGVFMFSTDKWFSDENGEVVVGVGISREQRVPNAVASSGGLLGLFRKG